MPKKLLIMLIANLLTGCTSVQVWELNDGIPHRPDNIERVRFKERMNTFIKFYFPDADPNDLYVINDKYLTIHVPCGYESSFSERVPYIACNPDGDEKKCKRIK